MMHRLFVAIDIPAVLRSNLEMIGCDLLHARRVPSDQLHLTLIFLGNVDTALFHEVKHELSSVHSSPFALTLKGVGHFPPGRKPRVLWVGVSPCEELLMLQKRVAEKVSAVGVPLESRAFSPHITLARFREPPEGIDQLESRYRDFRSDTFEVTEFYLYSSTIGPRGAVHTREESYRLRPLHPAVPEPSP